MSSVLPKHLFAGAQVPIPTIRVAPALVESAALEPEAVYAKLSTRVSGLTAEEAALRLRQYGPNALARDQRTGLLKLFWRAVVNPLVVLLAILAAVSFVTGDVRSGLMIASMIVLSGGLKLFQESRADNAAAKLKAMISVTARVVRDGVAAEIAVAQLAPGASDTATAFDRGITQFTWLMLRFMAVMVPLVFVINGLTKGNWVQAFFFFAMAVAVGLTPEMVPMIVTVCL